MIFKKIQGIADYQETIAAMEAHVNRMRAGLASEEVWLLEHPSIYTLGTSAKESDILHPSSKIPCYKTGRGGQVTYHGPGQRIAYVMLDLAQRKQDIRHYIWMLEEWLIAMLKDLGVQGQRCPGRVGLWVLTKTGQEQKIAAIGVRVKKWVTFHGISLNVNPDLSCYQNIIPCGLSGYGVTSLHDRGLRVRLSDVDDALEKNFRAVFEDASSPSNLSPAQFDLAQKALAHGRNGEF